MGKYINAIGGDAMGASFESKCAVLEKNGAVKIDQPASFQEGLVCVVNNGVFAAAGYAYDKAEFEYFAKGFKSGSDPRPHQWYVYKDAAKYAK